jgi:D-aminopeptidase
MTLFPYTTLFRSLKGGIGSASRRAGEHVVGALVLANFGRLGLLTLGGCPLGRRLAAANGPEKTGNSPAGAARASSGGDPAPEQPEQGSIIMLLATDAPLDARQLRRLAWRAGAGLARTGSVFGHGSGDIALAFSTAYTVPHLPSRPMPALAMLHETRLDPLFLAAADATEQAILHALRHAEPVRGRDGHARRTLREVLRRLPDEENPCAS